MKEDIQQPLWVENSIGIDGDAHLVKDVRPNKWKSRALRDMRLLFFTQILIIRSRLRRRQFQFKWSWNLISRRTLKFG